jgi:hypothetical protein
MALVPSFPKDEERLEALGHKGFVFPVDEALKLSHLPFKMTVGAMLEITKAACKSDSYEEAEQLLKERTFIRVNDDTIRAVTNTIGQIVLANDSALADKIWSKSPPWKFEEEKEDDKIAHTLYLEVDGAMVQTREKNEQESSSWKENKLGMAFSSNNIKFWTDKHGQRQHQILEREYTSIIGSAEEFKKYFYLLALKNGYGKYKNNVLLSDGATWIRNMKNELFGNIQQILDFYHLCENITNFAKEVFYNDESKYKPWSNSLCQLFKASKTHEAIEVIKLLGKKTLKRCKFKLINYINNNIDNIDYQKYIDKGFFIGSGAIESANRTVLQRRMKLPGMRWNVSSGQHLVTLTAKLRSQLWDRDVVEAVYRHYEIDPRNFEKNFFDSYSILKPEDKKEN